MLVSTSSAQETASQPKNHYHSRHSAIDSLLKGRFKNLGHNTRQRKHSNTTHHTLLTQLTLVCLTTTSNLHSAHTWLPSLLDCRSLETNRSSNQDTGTACPQRTNQPTSYQELHWTALCIHFESPCAKPLWDLFFLVEDELHILPLRSTTQSFATICNCKPLTKTGRTANPPQSIIPYSESDVESIVSQEG